MDEELLAKSQLYQWCDVEVKLIKCDDRSDGYKWECRRQIDSKRHKVEKSLRSESWFKNSKMTLQEILKFTYWWSQDLNQLQIKHELGLCSNTAVDWELLPRNMWLHCWKTVKELEARERQCKLMSKIREAQISLRTSRTRTVGVCWYRE